AAAGRTIGAYVPGAGERHFFGDAYGRHVGSRWALSGTAYLDAEQANSAPNPLLATVVAPVIPGNGGPGSGGNNGSAPPSNRPTQSVWQYTLGGTATRSAGERWTHVITAGVNGYRLAGLTVDPVAVPSTVDSALLAARGGADRATARASSVAR